MVVLHEVLQVFESGPKVGEAGSFAAELLVAQGFERLQRFEGGDEIGGKLFVVRVARGANSLIKFFRGAFFFCDGGSSRGGFLFAGGVRFISDAARFLILEKIELALGERQPANGNIELGADPSREVRRGTPNRRRRFPGRACPKTFP